MEQTLSDLESRLTQCQEQIAELNTKMAMVLQHTATIQLRLHKMERRVSTNTMAMINRRVW